MRIVSIVSSIVGIVGLTTAGAFAASPVFAQDKQPANAPPGMFDDLFACRAIADTAQRVACYDGKVDEIQVAVREKQIVVTDAKKLKEARRGLFGFSASKLLSLGGEDEQDLDEVETTVASARLNPEGQWLLTLEDGAVWRQIDLKRPIFDPKPGSKIRIHEGALGSFLAAIDGQRAMKMRRER